MTSSALIPIPSSSLLSVLTARPEARTRMRDFFSSHIRNPNIQPGWHADKDQSMGKWS
jgi:hypothetical protein